MSRYAVENEPTYCSIINGKCPEKTDGKKHTAIIIASYILFTTIMKKEAGR